MAELGAVSSGVARLGAVSSGVAGLGTVFSGVAELGTPLLLQRDGNMGTFQLIEHAFRRSPSDRICDDPLDRLQMVCGI